MCGFFGVWLANFLTAATAACALIAIISPHWLQTNSQYYGVVTFNANNTVESYFTANGGTETSLSAWPSSEWAAAYVCLVVGLCGTAIALVGGLISACLNCFCLCCLSFPFTIISSVFSFLSFILYLTSVLLFASKFDSGFNGSSFCGTSSGSFQLGQCSIDYALWVAVGAIVASLLASIVFGASTSTPGSKKSGK
eukprot:Pgem_evm1s19038